MNIMIPPEIINVKKKQIISRSYHETPFHHTSSPKLPIKAMYKLFARGSSNIIAGSRGWRRLSLPVSVNERQGSGPQKSNLSILSILYLQR